MTLYLDWFGVGPSGPALAPTASDSLPRYPKMGTALLALFLVLVVLAGIAALFYGFDTARAHLASPPPEEDRSASASRERPRGTGPARSPAPPGATRGDRPPRAGAEGTNAPKDTSSSGLR
ncbi:MAG: hypothetical protein WBF81_03000, partial [Thermoplasmata archaeon]